MRIYKTSVFVLTAQTALAAISLASIAPAGAQEIDIGEIVVTPNRAPGDKAKTGSKVEKVTKEDIASVIRGEPDLMNACKTLIDRANANGGPDNITVIIARFEGAGLRDPNDTDEVGHRIYPLPETGQTPAMPIDRVIDTNSPTQPMEAIPRPRTTKPMAQDEIAETVRESGRRKTVPLPAEDVAPAVSPALVRNSARSTIAPRCFGSRPR